MRNIRKKKNKDDLKKVILESPSYKNIKDAKVIKREKKRRLSNSKR